MEKITAGAKDLAMAYGAGAVGIVTTEMLAGGPPSTDLAYVLPHAKTAISFAVPLDQKFIESWFNKQSRADHFRDNIRTNFIASGISLERIAKMDDDIRSLYEKV
jgi:epoxyqueuosine reductase